MSVHLQCPHSFGSRKCAADTIPATPTSSRRTCPRRKLALKSSPVRASDILHHPVKLHTAESFRKSKEQPRGDPTPAAVYTVRIQTSNDRSSGLEDLHAGVQLCLIGKVGEVLLHRIGQLEPPSNTLDTMAEVCSVAGTDAGASCDSLPSTTLDKPPSDYIKRRFQAGSIDEVTFVGPNLGPLAAVLIGPELGGWKMEEVVVSNSREACMQRFICREKMGDRKGSPGAALMTPLSANTVVYGSGDSAVLMTQAQAENMRRLGVREYMQLKVRIFKTTAALVVLGMGLAFATGGAQAAEAFTLGGSVAFMYQLLLNQNVDGFSSGAALNGEAYSPPDVLGQHALESNEDADWVRGLLGNGVLRLSIVGACMLAVILGVHSWADASGQDEEVHKLSIIATTLLGFATYKVAVVAAAMTPSNTKEAAEDPITKT